MSHLPCAVSAASLCKHELLSKSDLKQRRKEEEFVFQCTVHCVSYSYTKNYTLLLIQHYCQFCFHLNTPPQHTCFSYVLRGLASSFSFYWAFSFTLTEVKTQIKLNSTKKTAYVSTHSCLYFFLFNQNLAVSLVSCLLKPIFGLVGDKMSHQQELCLKVYVS